MNILYWKKYLFLHILVLDSHFFLVLPQFSHSKTKQYKAGKEQSCHRHWPGHSIFGLINHNTWKGHKERRTLMPKFGNWKAGWIELICLPETRFLQRPWGVHWSQSCSGTISMPCSHISFCIYTIAFFHMNVFLVRMFQNWPFLYFLHFPKTLDNSWHMVPSEMVFVRMTK